MLRPQFLFRFVFVNSMFKTLKRDKQKANNAWYIL